MWVTFFLFYNDEAEHIKNQHDDLTLHHLIREIEKKKWSATTQAPNYYH